jgi:cytochrome P450
MRLLSTEASSEAQGPITRASGRFDPFASDYLTNPYPTLQELRSSEPVFYSPDLGSWIVTRYETIKTILRDPQRFSASIVSDPLTPLCPHARQMAKDSGFHVPPLLVNNDPPTHPRYRAFFGAPLSRTRLQSLHPFVEKAVAEHLDRLAQGPQPADLVAGLTYEVPAFALFQLLGIPSEDVPKVKEWAASRLVLTWGRPTEQEQITLTKGAIDYYHYAHALVQEKLKNPADDYISDLIRLRDGDDAKATLHEIGTTCFNLLFAGHETTSSAAANMFKAVLSDPELLTSIRSGEQRLSAVVEEAIRMDPPIQSWRRLVKKEVTLDGITLPAGSRLLMMFAAANHDPEQFENPEEFCPTRRNVMQHVSFGAGAHFCLGAPLARMEMEIMLQQVIQRFPGIKLLPNQQFSYVPNTAARALRQLMVTW